jgi:hypothetical protein
MYCNMAFIDYLDLVDSTMIEVFGISTSDEDMDCIAECQECDETPEECVRQIGEKVGMAGVV